MSFAAKLKNFFSQMDSSRNPDSISRPNSLSEVFFDDLCDLLVEGDFGAAAAMKLAERLKNIAKKENIIHGIELKKQLVQLLSDELMDADPDEQVEKKSQNSLIMILLLGVNGVGKTTTAAKLANRYKSQGRTPILAAADTFRAGAINQLKIHGEKLNVRVIAHQQGGDPAAVVYDAVEAALSGKGDVIIADTAGRMHTKAALVEELKKIDRVLENKLGRNQSNSAIESIKWLVLDATTGRNALSQAETFHQAVKLDGAILTKYDSSARGGIVFSLASELTIPTVFLCDGESYDHIKPFDKSSFAKGFVL